MKFCWTTLTIADMEASLAFYTQVVGLSVDRRMKPSPDMELVFLGEGETKLELIWNAKAPAATMGEAISVGFEVESLDAMTEKLKARGIPVHSGPFEPNPRVRFLFVLDPNGLKVQFLENHGGNHE